jgi:hypothetical protein
MGEEPLLAPHPSRHSSAIESIVLAIVATITSVSKLALATIVLSLRRG